MNNHIDDDDQSRDPGTLAETRWLYVHHLLPLVCDLKGFRRDQAQAAIHAEIKELAEITAALQNALR